MKEAEIRPDDLLKRQKQYLEHDVGFLLSNKSEFVLVACPGCETQNNSIEMEKNGFAYRECQRCGMLYMSPRPSITLLRKFYPQSPNYKFFNEYIFPSTCEVRREKIFKPRVEKVIKLCEKYEIRTDKILEIGCGFGLFCEEIARKNIFKEVVGIEATDSLFNTCKEKGFRIYNGVLEDLEINEEFAFIVAFEVIEHIFNPFKFLSIVNKLLSIKGGLMLTFPNYEGFEIGILRECSSTIDHEHLNYFTCKSISLLLNKTGFEIVELETPGKIDVDLVKKAYESNLIKNSFIKLLGSDAFFEVREKLQDFFAENKLSSHMMVIARKVKNISESDL